ncbi:MAG: RNA methyltransferase [Myxococcota bacterium]
MSANASKTGRKRLWSPTPPPYCENVRIALIQPKKGANVGASARAMNNFGFSKLSLIGDSKFDEREAKYVAHNSKEIIENAENYPTIDEALTGAQLVVGTTARRVFHRKSITSLKAAIPKIAEIAKKSEVAILFGPEWRGLSDSELERCEMIVTIPTGGPQPSLNLAQAVGIFCYELFYALAEPPEKPVSWRIASRESFEGFWKHLEETIAYIDFLPPTGKERITYTLRDMLCRAQPDEREVVILRGILRKLGWYLKRVPKKDREK